MRPTRSTHPDVAGAVYVLSNQRTGNAVLEYARSADGTLSFAASHPTGGLGTAAALGSQGAVVVDEAGAYLYAVNPGSSSITSFRIDDGGLEQVMTVPSGGTMPTSVTVHEDRLYVLNSGGPGSVAGFAVSDGRLAPLAGSERALSGAETSPAQVSFTPDGSRLLVTERATNRIDVIDLNGAGVPVGFTSVPSSGAVPFGFDFDNKGRALVSEAAGSAASSYALSADGLAVISGSVSNTEAAACWLVVTGNGMYAYTGNAGGSLSISGYRIDPDGALSLLTPGGKTASTAAGVTDLALSRDSRFLYSRLGDGTVGAFAVQPDGGLSPLPAAAGLPEGAAGIAAR